MCQNVSGVRNRCAGVPVSLLFFPVDPVSQLVPETGS